VHVHNNKCNIVHFAFISPPENDSFRKDLCFSLDVLFIYPSARSLRRVGRY